MPDFLTRMAERALQQGPVAQPLIAPRFAPAAALPEIAAPTPEDRPVPKQTDSGPPRGEAIAAGAIETLPQLADWAPPDVGAAPPVPPTSITATMTAIDPVDTLSLSSAPRAASLSSAQSASNGRDVFAAATAWEDAAPSRIAAAPADLGASPTPHPTLPMPDAQAAAPQMLPLSDPPARPLAPPPARRTQPSGEDPAAPVIRVTIGRIDVRAQLSAAPAARAPRRAPPAALSLEDYARERREGKR